MEHSAEVEGMLFATFIEELEMAKYNQNFENETSKETTEKFRNK